jgi:hypothetical protein
MEIRSSLDDQNRLPVYPMRVLRVDPGQAWFVRMLSKRYWGLFTHWEGGRGVYCPGEGCPAARHAKQRLWKGYASAEVYEQRVNLWHPCVLEITEHLELDFRDRFDRGQVWHLTREMPTDKRKTPVVGELHETCDETKWPSAFDIVPVLKTVYHVQKIEMGFPNPMPARTMVQPSEGAPPAALMDRSKPVIPATPEQIKWLHERLGRVPSPSKNGVHSNGQV